jgi:hypothetical protein
MACVTRGAPEPRAVSKEALFNINFHTLNVLKMNNIPFNPVYVHAELKEGKKIVMKTRNGRTTYTIRTDNDREWRVIKFALAILAICLFIVLMINDAEASDGKQEKPGVYHNDVIKKESIGNKKQNVRPKLKADIYELEAFLKQQEQERRARFN